VRVAPPRQQQLGEVAGREQRTGAGAGRDADRLDVHRSGRIDTLAGEQAGLAPMKVTVAVARTPSTLPTQQPLSASSPLGTSIASTAHPDG